MTLNVTEWLIFFIIRIHVQLVQMDEKAKQEKNQLNCDIADAKVSFK